MTDISRRQVIDIPLPAPVVTEHRAQARRCRCCGAATTAPFPEAVRAPVSYGPRVRAIVVYLLARQHIPVERSAEAMADLFGVRIATGTVDAIYNEASRRLVGFIAALVAWLRTLPVLHADETTDRTGTVNCWMHVVSTGLYTLVHASATRSAQAIAEAGVLVGYRGVIVHDRLALYWTLKKARHGVCAAHLLRDLASVAAVATQTAWAAGLAALLVEVNVACDAARAAGHRCLAPTRQRAFRSRYDALVAEGLAANPDPAPGRQRTILQRQSSTRHRLRHPLPVGPPLHVRPRGFDEAEARVLGIQTKLHRWATDDPDRRFDDLYNLVADPAFLVVAWHRVRGNRGHGRPALMG